MSQRAIRFSETTDEGIREGTENRGFASPIAPKAIEAAFDTNEVSLDADHESVAGHATDRYHQRIRTLGQLRNLHVRLGQP